MHADLIADVNSKGLNDWTALHLASHGNRSSICQILVEKYDANLECKTTENRTPCHLAAIKCNIDCLKVLIDANCNINAIDNDCNTPLHLSSKLGIIKSVEYLLRRRADYELVNKQSLTALEIASSVEIKDTFYKFITAVSSRRDRSPIENKNITKRLDTNINQRSQ